MLGRGMRKSNLIANLIRIEPGISLGQWAFDRVSNNWDRLAALFVGGGGMSYLASITDWVKSYGPVAVGAIGLFSALAIWIGLAWANAMRASAGEHAANASAIEKWQ